MTWRVKSPQYKITPLWISYQMDYFKIFKNVKNKQHVGSKVGDGQNYTQKSQLVSFIAYTVFINLSKLQSPNVEQQPKRGQGFTGKIFNKNFLKSENCNEQIQSTTFNFL